jgi:hypothetical protein
MMKNTPTEQRLFEYNGNEYITWDGGAVLSWVWYERFDPFINATPCFEQHRACTARQIDAFLGN